MKEITAEARKAGRESVAILDNLSGQTTELHRKNLAKHKCKRHLLPAGMTDELQLIDDGVGYALKNEMGKLHDEWMQEPGNLELWTAEGKDFPMWKKRVLITHLAAKAWENICSRFNFEAAATRLGMRMTVDGTGDQFICIQGINNYTFCDADGGDPGAESADEGIDAEEAETAGADVDGAAVEAADSSDAEEIDSSDTEAEGGDTDSSADDDDTAIPGTVATFIGSAVAPEGYEIVGSCAPLATEADLHNFIGKIVYVGHDSKQARGWFVGRVHSCDLSRADLKKTPSANFIIKYQGKDTGNKIKGSEARKLSADTYGTDLWWVELTKI